MFCAFEYRHSILIFQAYVDITETSQRNIDSVTSLCKENGQIYLY